MVTTPQTRIDLPKVSLTLAEIRTLEIICISGLPDTIDQTLKETLEILVCQSINPMRPLWEE